MLSAIIKYLQAPQQFRSLILLRPEAKHVQLLRSHTRDGAKSPLANTANADFHL